MLIAFLLLFFPVENTSVARANPSSEAITTNATSTTNSLATTTAQAPFILGTTATSTKEFNLENGNTVQVSLGVYSTTSVPRITVGLETSNNNIDWYSFEGSPAVGALTSGKPTNVWSWLAATTTADETVYKSFVLSNSFVAKYGRLLYKVNGAAGTGAQLHVEVAVKKEF